MLQWATPEWDQHLMGNHLLGISFCWHNQICLTRLPLLKDYFLVQCTLISHRIVSLHFVHWWEHIILLTQYTCGWTDFRLQCWASEMHLISGWSAFSMYNLSHIIMVNGYRCLILFINVCEIPYSQWYAQCLFILGLRQTGGCGTNRMWLPTELH